MTFAIAIGFPLAVAILATVAVMRSKTAFFASLACLLVGLFIFSQGWPRITTWYAGPLASFGYVTTAFISSAIAGFGMVGVFGFRRLLPAKLLVLVGFIASAVFLDRGTWVS